MFQVCGKFELADGDSFELLYFVAECTENAADFVELSFVDGDFTNIIFYKMENGRFCLLFSIFFFGREYEAGSGARDVGLLFRG